MTAWLTGSMMPDVFHCAGQTRWTCASSPRGSSIDKAFLRTKPAVALARGCRPSQSPPEATAGAGALSPWGRSSRPPWPTPPQWCRMAASWSAPWTRAAPQLQHRGHLPPAWAGARASLLGHWTLAPPGSNSRTGWRGSLSLTRCSERYAGCAAGVVIHQQGCGS